MIDRCTAALREDKGRESDGMGRDGKENERKEGRNDQPKRTTSHHVERSSALSRHGATDFQRVRERERERCSPLPVPVTKVSGFVNSRGPSDAQAVEPHDPREAEIVHPGSHPPAVRDGLKEAGSFVVSPDEQCQAVSLSSTEREGAGVGRTDGWKDGWMNGSISVRSVGSLVERMKRDGWIYA